MPEGVRMTMKIAMLMKLAFVTMLAACLLLIVPANAQEAAMSLNVKQVPISKVLQLIEQKTGYKFVYANNFFPAELLISLQVNKASVTDVLTQLLKNTSFTFKQVDRDLIVITGITANDTPILIKGTVADNKSERLPGVTVALENGNVLTATNEKGEYSIHVPVQAILVFTSVAHVTVKEPVNERQQIDIVMKENVSNMNELVVMGYGQRFRRDITGAVSVITSKDIEKSTALSPQLAMQGQMPGVNIISSGSNPTARPTVRIRGVSTFSANGAADPLYIIDGIPLAEGGAGATVDKVNDPTRRGPINLYTIIDPHDIESITVLKDAAAAAVYGVRAANGVILITTKTGKKGKVRLDANIRYGIQKIIKTYDVLNTQQYVKFYTDAYNVWPDISGNTPIPIAQAAKFGPRWDPANPSYFGNDPTYDWQRAIINRHSANQQYHIRVSGASDNTSYNFSFGYTSNDGAFIGYDVNRYSVSTNVTSKIGKHLELGLNCRGVQQSTHNPPEGDLDVNLDVWRAPPWQKIQDVSGPYGLAPIWQLNAPLTPTVFNKSSLYAQQYVAYRNVFGLLAANDNKSVNQTALGTAYVQLQPVRGLKLKATFSAQQTNLSVKSWQGFDRWWFQENPSNPFNGTVNPVAGTKPDMVGIDNRTTVNTMNAFNIDYVRLLNNHNINITIDASQQQYKWIGNGVSGTVFTNDPDQRYFTITGNERGYDELRAQYALIGYLARLNYHYNNTYYLEGVIRRDGSSRFAPDHRWGTFPSVAGGWRISKEGFMKRVAFINDLKIRGGYGVLGNEQTTGGWSYLSVANAVSPSYNLGNPQTINRGIAFSGLPNPELTWERLHSANIGFDALLFSNRLSFTFDYYHKITKGIIQSVNLNPSTGITTPVDMNIADVLNRGIELQLNYTQTIGKITFSCTGNFTTVHNEVLNLANHTALRSAGLEEGLPIGFIYGYKVGGIFQSHAEIDTWNKTTKDLVSKEQKPGDIWFQNLYGAPIPGHTHHNVIKDSMVNENDQTNLGKTIPGYYYGFTFSSNYKSFDCTVFFQGVGDVQKYNGDRAAGEAMNGYGRNQFASVRNAWTEQNKFTGMPRAVYNDPNGNTRMSDRFVENAGYLRLQNVQIAYTVPKNWLNKTHAIQTLQLYIAGINLFTITRYSGLDPENDHFPATRQLLAGIKASFQ